MITLVIHDSGEFPCYPEHWADVRSAFDIQFVYKIGGKPINGFVNVKSTDNIPKTDDICLVVTPSESELAALNAIDLSSYEHPNEVTYVFGPDDNEKGWHDQWDFTGCVTIRTPSATELYASHAAAMVLYDRLQKGAQ